MFDSCCELIQMSDKYFAWLEINVADAVSDKNKQTNTTKQTNKYPFIDFQYGIKYSDESKEAVNILTRTLRT